jgi:hypothetical protein
METLYFILGALSVVTILAVVSVFMIKSNVKSYVDREIEKSNDNLDRIIIDLEADLRQRLDMIERRIDQEIDRTNRMYSDSIRYTDSKTDKMSDGISKHIAELHQRCDNIEINLTDYRPSL